MKAIANTQKALGNATQPLKETNKYIDSYKQRKANGGATQEATLNVVERHLDPKRIVKHHICDKLLGVFAILCSCCLIVPLIIICILASQDVVSWDQVEIVAYVLAALAGILLLAVCVNVVICGNPFVRMFRCFREVRKEKSDVESNRSRESGNATSLQIIK